MLFKILAPFLSLFLLLVATEIYLRFRFPFAIVRWPCRFDPRVGSVFKPNSVVQWTNHLDFAVRQKANSLGFLDREHELEKPADTLRILVLGDSYVEAAQVEIAEKLHAVLEKELARRYPSRRFEAIAMGHSGYGTSNVLAFYEHMGRRFGPDVVVVLFVSNDFADNSPVLEAVRHGWHPRHCPRLFFEKGDRPGEFRRQEIDPECGGHTLPVPRRPPPPAPAGWRASIRTYAYLSALLGRAAETKAREARKMYEERIRLLRRMEAFRDLLEGWRYPDDLALDPMFHAEKMPRAFSDAVEITEHVLKVFRDAAAADGAGFLLVAGDGCSATLAGGKGGRTIIEKGYFKRLKAIADRQGIPLLDLFEAFSRRGNPRAAHFRHDGHWNRTGHRWAGEAICEYLAAHEEEFLAGPEAAGSGGAPRGERD